MPGRGCLFWQGTRYLGTWGCDASTGGDCQSVNSIQRRKLLFLRSSELLSALVSFFFSPFFFTLSLVVSAVLAVPAVRSHIPARGHSRQVGPTLRRGSDSGAGPASCHLPDVFCHLSPVVSHCGRKCSQACRGCVVLLPVCHWLGGCILCVTCAQWHPTLSCHYAGLQ